MQIKEKEMLSEIERENIGDVLPQVNYPWRRYLARSFDGIIYMILWTVFLALAFHVSVTDRNNAESFLDTIITTIMMLFLEPLLLHLFGTTPGKEIFGLKIENPDGSHLSYGEGLKRIWGVSAGEWDLIFQFII